MLKVLRWNGKKRAYSELNATVKREGGTLKGRCVRHTWPLGGELVVSRC